MSDVPRVIGDRDLENGTVSVRLRSDEDPEQWFYARLALLFLLGASSVAAVWLWALATREIRSLGELATEARLEAARQAREKKGRPRG